MSFVTMNYNARAIVKKKLNKTSYKTIVVIINDCLHSYQVLQDKLVRGMTLMTVLDLLL